MSPEDLPPSLGALPPALAAEVTYSRALDEVGVLAVASHSGALALAVLQLRDMPGEGWAFADVVRELLTVHDVLTRPGERSRFTSPEHVRGALLSLASAYAALREPSLASLNTTLDEVIRHLAPARRRRLSRRGPVRCGP